MAFSLIECREEMSHPGKREERGKAKEPEQAKNQLLEDPIVPQLNDP